MLRMAKCHANYGSHELFPFYKEKIYVISLNKQKLLNLYRQIFKFTDMHFFVWKI